MKPNASLRWTQFRATLFAVFVLSTTLIAGPAEAQATGSDWVVNIVAGKSTFMADETVTYTVDLDNRGPQDSTTNSTLAMEFPNAIGSDGAWVDNITCVATHNAVCPTGYTFDDETGTVSAIVAPTPVGGKLALTVPVEGNPANYMTGVLRVVANLAIDATASDAEPATNTSVINVEVQRQSNDMSITSEVDDYADPDSEFQWDLTVANSGRDAARTQAVIVAGALNGTASNPNPTPAMPDLNIVDITCVATGTASCADVELLDYDTRLPVDPQPSSLVPTPLSALRVATGMIEPGSSLEFAVILDVGAVACSTSGGFRNIELETAIAHYSGYQELPYSGANNSAAELVNVEPDPCTLVDLEANSLTQGAVQTTTGVSPSTEDSTSSFEYTANYSNGGAEDASDATISFHVAWPTADDTTVSAAVDNAPTCVANGGATCPTSWTLTSQGVSGIAASMPTGGSLEITYSGTTGGDSTMLCSPQYLRAYTTIYPSASDDDVNYASTSYGVNQQSQGNNGYHILTQADVGVDCLESHDETISMEGPFTDPEATQLLIGQASPGDTLYFRTEYSNVEPGYDFASYSTRTTINLDFRSFCFTGFAEPCAPFATGFDEDGNPYASAWEPGTPAGLSTPDGNWSFDRDPQPHDSGVRCVEATGGYVCPSAVGTGGTLAGGGDPMTFHTSGWSISQSATDGDPVFPIGAQAEFISTYRIPPLHATYAAGGCYADGVTLERSMDGSINGITNPATSERVTANNNASVDFEVYVPPCDGELAVTKVAEDDYLPSSGIAAFDIVVTNNSAFSLDLPKLMDKPVSGLAGGTLTCVETTGGALCPTFEPEYGVRRLADGSTETIADTGGTVAMFDFVWGSAGADTMPGGSTVTFRFEGDYSDDPPVSISNTVTFTGDSSSTTGGWPTVRASDSVRLLYGQPVLVMKSVSPQRPSPGQEVTFTVDVVNNGLLAENLLLIDEMHASFVATNPDGYGNITCRALTAADDVVYDDAVAEAPCPTLVSTVDGMSGLIETLPANSGLRITYTAIAPLSAASVPNVVTLEQDPDLVTLRDVESWANISVITVNIAGTVWHDENNSANGSFSGIQNGTEPGVVPEGAIAILVGADGTVLGTTPINADGTYGFANVPADTEVSVYLGIEGSTTPGLDASWAGTTPLAQTTFNTGFTDTLNIDFGVQKLPDTDDKTEPIQVNPGGTTRVQVPSLTGDDPEDGAHGEGSTFEIVTLPNPNTMGVLYYNGVPVTAGLVIANYDPALLTVDPVDGAPVVTFTVAVFDEAGNRDLTPATVTMPFSVASTTTTTATTTSTTSTTSTTKTPSTLAYTGSGAGSLTSLATLLLGLGALMTLLGRRRHAS